MNSFQVPRRVVVENEIFQSNAARGSGARTKFLQVPRRVVVGKEIFSHAVRGSGARQKFFQVPRRVVVEKEILKGPKGTLPHCS